MSTSVMTRRRNTLDPITTNVAPQQHRKSSVSALSARPNFSLLSPRLAAAHAYYHENDSTPTSAKANSSQRRKSVLEEEQFPRRHLIIASPGGAITSHFANFSFGSTKDKQKLTPVLESEAANPRAVNVKGEKAVAAHGIKTEDVETKDATKMPARKTPAIKLLDTDVTATPQNTPIKPNQTPIFPHQQPQQQRRRSASDVPYEYIHTRLREWGRLYLLNTSSADVFINPIALRRPSVSPAETSETKNKVNIRARVVPKAKDRKPFVIHQKFDVEDFRAKIPIPSSGKETSKTPRLRRSNRHRSFVRGGEGHRRGKSLGSMSGMGPFGLHEEYALHFLPILAALLFSGHVCKGDLIDLPIPHPEAWEDVLKWVYTGGDASEVSEEVRENVAFLGGDVV